MYDLYVGFNCDGAFSNVEAILNNNLTVVGSSIVQVIWS